MWFYCSPFPGERTTAAHRFEALRLRFGFDPEELLLALSDWALGTDKAGEPFHAKGFTEAVARSFMATIRERQRDERRAEEAKIYYTTDPAPQIDKSLHRVSFADPLAIFGRSGC